MDITSIRDAVDKRPFRPFQLFLADGGRVAVRQPEFVATTKRIVVVAAEDNSVAILEPLLIVSLEYLGNGPKRGNGSARRKPPDS